MTIGAWLRERAAAPPPLTTRIVEILGDRLDDPADRAADVLLGCADRLLGELVARPSPGRDTALDLLAVDALVTYAFEAASADPARLSAQSTAAMRRLARLAT